MAALLQISDTSRIKIVGVYNGSVTVVTVIEPSSTTTSTVAQVSELASITTILNTAIADGSLASEMSAAGFGSLTNVQVTEHTL